MAGSSVCALPSPTCQVPRVREPSLPSTALSRARVPPPDPREMRPDPDPRRKTEALGIGADSAAHCYFSESSPSASCPWRLLRCLHLEHVRHHFPERRGDVRDRLPDRESTRLNCSHAKISYAVFCLEKKRIQPPRCRRVRTHKRASPVSAHAVER